MASCKDSSVLDVGAFFKNEYNGNDDENEDILARNVFDQCAFFRIQWRVSEFCS